MTGLQIGGGGSYVIPNYGGLVPNLKLFTDQLTLPQSRLELESIVLDRFSRIKDISGEIAGNINVDSTPMLRKRFEPVRSKVKEVLDIDNDPIVYLYHGGDVNEFYMNEAMSMAGVELTDVEKGMVFYQPAKFAVQYLGQEVGALYLMVNEVVLVKEHKEREGIIQNGMHLQIGDENSVVLIREGQADIDVDLYLGHEYTHALQHSVGYRDPQGEIRPLLEGHALGVERLLATAFALADPRYLERVLMKEAFRLSAAYATVSVMAGEDGMNPVIAQFIHDMGTNNMFVSKAHELGQALFVLAEQRHGIEIYKRMLMGDLEFLYLAA